MLTLSYRGLRELDWRLRMLAVCIRSELPSVMQEIAEGMAETARQSIGREKPSWPPLAASTVREKQRHGWTWRISETDPLFASGKMRTSIWGEGDAMVAVVRADGPAIFHELGTQRMPRRAFLRPAVREISPVARRLLAETLALAIGES